MKTFIITFLALFAVAVNAASKRPYEDRFVDYGVYKIENRAVVGVLTFNRTNFKVLPTTEEFDDANPGQRWRLDQAALYTSFQLRPTTDEKYVLEYVNDQGALKWLASLGWGQNKMWYLQDAGDGFTQIKNKHNEVCLESRGISNATVASMCNNRHEQQWKLVFTS